MMRRILVFTALLLAIGAGIYFWPSAVRPAGQREAVPPGDVRPGPDGSARPTAAPPPIPAESPGGRDAAPAAPPPTSVQLESDFPIAAPLNAPDSNVDRDLDILRQLFEAWQSNFPREGNPVGENAEITAALMGENRLGFALVPRGHRALNERGELCDRWGTPLRFHQLSGTRMEVRSAGPDRKFGTEDDAVLTPP